MSGLLLALEVAWRTESTIGEVPERWRPTTVDEAYAIAARLVADRGEVVGWKIGATSVQGQRVLGLAEPFFGRIFANVTHHSPARVPAGQRTLALEPEIAFAMAADLPAREKPYEIAEVRAATAAFVPAVEVNWPPYARPFEVGGTSLIAANGVNAGVVLGAPRPLPSDETLLDVTATLQVDDVAQASGTCAAALGPPLVALTWLAEALRRRGLGLHRGDVVCVGALTRPAEVRAGQWVRADFGAFGTVEATLVP